MFKFKDFEEEINQGAPRYVQLREGAPIKRGPIKGVSFNEIQAIANTDPTCEIGWLVPKGWCIIDIDSPEEAKVVFQIIKDRKEKVLVEKTTRGIHIYCKSEYNFKTVKNILALGCYADTCVYGNGKSYIKTCFHNPKVYTGKAIKGRKVIYYTGEIGEIPFWLHPIFNKGGLEGESYITFPLEDCRNDTYNRHLWRLKKSPLTPKERAECIRLINTYIATSPLSEQELEATMLRDSNNEDSPQEQFFTKSGAFQHDAMGHFLIEYLKIKKDSKSKTLYYYSERKGIYVSNNDYIKGVMTKLCPVLKEFQKKEVLNFLESYLELNLSDFNKNPLSICFENGILDLRTMTLEEPSPEHLETIRLHVKYNPEAVGPTADEFFKTATCGNKSVETLLYEAIGYSFLKTPQLHKAFLLIGGGRNGKSTYLDVIKEICGRENCASLDFKDLGEKFRVGMLHNKLVSLSGDISSQPLKDSDLFKQIVGGDEITIERKNAHPFNDTVFSTLMFSANTLPRTPDTTSGFYRRLCIIPFNADLSKVSLVDGMEFRDNLMKDLEYIAFRAVQAIHNVLTVTHTFTVPTEVDTMMEDYRIENSSVLSWLKAKALTITDMKAKPCDELYAEYSVWCDVNGFKTVRSSRFEKEVESEFKLIKQGTEFVDK